MIVVLSPAKSLDFTTPPSIAEHTQPQFLGSAQVLVEQLRRLSPAELAGLMRISDPLAVLNATRYADWQQPFTPDNAKQAVLAFNGDVYTGLAATTLTPAALHFAQDHLRILSGLYGVLRPLDLIAPYRLEMGTRLVSPSGRDLYAFWGERIAETLNAAAREVGASALINLASQEYFKAVAAKTLTLPVITPIFEDWSAGRFKVVSFYAKRARGLMARSVLAKRLKSPSALKKFSAEGYAFVAAASSETHWVFRRRLAAQ